MAGQMRACLIPLVLVGVVSLGFASARDAGQDAEGFSPLFNGKDFAGLKFYVPDKADPMKTWAVKDNSIICTGSPNAYFYTDKSYKNYVLCYDWRYMKPPEGKKSTFNSGCLVHIQEHKIWPKCVEVQGANANHGKYYFLGAKNLGEKYDQKTKDMVTKPIGEWNTTEITCLPDGAIVAKINGTQVNSGKSDLIEGPIGWQSEGAEIHFRNIKVKEGK